MPTALRRIPLSVVSNNAILRQSTAVPTDRRMPKVQARCRGSPYLDGILPVRDHTIIIPYRRVNLSGKRTELQLMLPAVMPRFV